MFVLHPSVICTVCLLRRLLRDDYTEGDVREILDSLRDVLKADMANELEHAAHTHVLVLKQLFQQAEGMGLNFSVDTGSLENQSLLSEMKQFEADMDERKATEAKMSVSRGPALATLSKAGDAAGHIDLVRKTTSCRTRCGSGGSDTRLSRSRASAWLGHTPLSDPSARRSRQSSRQCRSSSSRL